MENFKSSSSRKLQGIEKYDNMTTVIASVVLGFVLMLVFLLGGCVK